MRQGGVLVLDGLGDGDGSSFSCGRAMTRAGAAPERIDVDDLMSKYFEALGVKPPPGRFFLPLSA